MQFHKFHRGTENQTSDIINWLNQYVVSKRKGFLNTDLNLFLVFFSQIRNWIDQSIYCEENVMQNETVILYAIYLEKSKPVQIFHYVMEQKSEVSKKENFEVFCYNN